MLTAAYGGYGLVGRKNIKMPTDAYACGGGGFGLTLTQKTSDFYNLDTEKVNNLQLNTKSQLYPKKTTSM